MKDDLERAGKASGRLAADDDLIQSIITRIEKAVEAHVNVKIEVALGHDEWLVWGKHNGDWCFLYKTKVNKTSLKHASREIRARMFADGAIEKLIRAAPGILEGMLVQRRAALIEADKLLEAFRRFDEQTKGNTP